MPKTGSISMIRPCPGDFLNLPAEIQHQILSNAIPSGLKFCIRVRAHVTDPEPAFEISLPKFRVTYEDHECDEKRRGHRIPHHVLPRYIGSLCMMSVLLLHRSLLPWVMDLMYGRNVFSFLNVYGLEQFIEHIPSAAVAAIRSMEMHVYPEALDHLDGGQSWRRYSWLGYSSSLDYKVIGALHGFSRLQEIHLPGIGPGITEKVRGRGNVYKWNEQIWKEECVDYLMSLVGENGDSANSHPLIGGRAFGKRLTMENRKRSRILGTRVVKRDSDCQIAEDEEEIDLADILKKAQDYQQLWKAR